MRSIWLCLIIAMAAKAAGQAANPDLWWPQFRGPSGNGVADRSDAPVHFGPETNVVWKTTTPPGHSSPCIWDGRIFLTGCEQNKLFVFCLDRRTGQELWRQTAPATPLEPVSGLGNPAASTPATDGHLLFVYYGSFGLLAYDLGGREAWRLPLATPITQHGAGTSPVLAGDLLLINRDQDVDSHLLAIDKHSGKIIWRADRPGFRRGFSTPAIVGNLVIVPGTLRLAAYDLATGKEQWSVSGFPNEMCSSPVVANEMVYVAGWSTGPGPAKFPTFQNLLDSSDQDKDGRLSRTEAPPGPAQQHFIYMDANKDGFLTREEYESIARIFAVSKNAAMAVRLGGQGDVSSSHVFWKQAKGLPYVPSPLFFQDRLYLVKNGGMVSCFNAANGAPFYLEERLGVTGDNYASPVAAAGKIYIASQNGSVAVLAAGDSFNVLARNPMGEKVMATPAIVENRLYLRTASQFYAFGTGFK